MVNEMDRNRVYEKEHLIARNVTKYDPDVFPAQG